jgi:hypothetical protein
LDRECRGSAKAVERRGLFARVQVRTAAEEAGPTPADRVLEYHMESRTEQSWTLTRARSGKSSGVKLDPSKPTALARVMSFLDSVVAAAKSVDPEAVRPRASPATRDGPGKG